MLAHTNFFCVSLLVVPARAISTVLASFQVKTCGKVKIGGGGFTIFDHLAN
jgi:hypothetical protein